METRFLETFVAVIKAGSIAAAARALDIAPTTIRQQINALEKDIGCALLVPLGIPLKPVMRGIGCWNVPARLFAMHGIYVLPPK